MEFCSLGRRRAEPQHYAWFSIEFGVLNFISGMSSLSLCKKSISFMYPEFDEQQSAEILLPIIFAIWLKSIINYKNLILIY